MKGKNTLKKTKLRN